MRRTIMVKAITLSALALAGAGAALIAPSIASSYTLNDLYTLGYNVTSDNKGNGCIAWSAGIPGFSHTLIGEDCWATFPTLLNNYINSTLATLQAHQATNAATQAAVPTVTVTAPGTTIYDSAGGTFTVTITNPAATVTAPGVTITTPAVTLPSVTDTETETTYLTVPGPTITAPPLIVPQLTTVTQTIQEPAPAPQTVTQIVTQTETVTTTDVLTVTVPAKAAKLRPRIAKPHVTARMRRAFRTG